MRSSRTIGLVCLSVLILGSVYVIAQEQASSKAPTMTAEQKAMMDAWLKNGTPGPQHEKIKSLAGKWDADVSMQMDPAAPEEKSKATMVNQSIFDGRFLQQDYNGTFMGQPFKGMGMVGFDNQKQKYVMGWIDSMDTAMMVAEGTADESGKVITFKSEMDCPGTNEKVSVRQVLTIQDNDHHTFESYQTKKGSAEFKGMTIKYTRAGS